MGVPEEMKLVKTFNGATVDTEGAGFRGPRWNIGLNSFVEKRRAHLLNHPAVTQTRD